MRGRLLMAWNLQRNNLNWHYFLAIESDAIRISRFVEFHPNNMHTFSIELARILLAASAKVEVVGKLIAGFHGKQPTHIGGVREAVMDKHPLVSEAQVSLPRYGLTVVPFRAWGRGESPDWWHAYNSLKHDYEDAFSRGSLGHSLGALSGLLVLLLVHCRISGADALMPATELFYPPTDFGVGAMTPDGRIIDLRDATH